MTKNSFNKNFMYIQLFEHVISADVHMISPGFRRFRLSGYKLHGIRQT